MAVVVQRMVRADAAGVAMTLNPANGDRCVIAIESAFGLGETVVGGTVTPDRFLVDKVMLEVVETATRRQARRADAGGHARRRAGAPPTRSSSPPSRSAPIATLAKRAEQHHGSPQDLEWAVSDGEVLLLQCRPETVWSKQAAPAPPASRAACWASSTRWSTRWPPGGARMSAPPIERFISPYEDAAPAGAEGWQDLYPYYLTFREDRREIEEGKFWFADLAHWPRVFKPFDTIMVEFACKCLGQYNTRHYLIPPANGIDYRVHNGYTYMSPVAVPEEEIPARVPQFLARAGHYFANWPTLLENWERKMRRVIADLEAISFEPLPDGRPRGVGHRGHAASTTRSG